MKKIIPILLGLALFPQAHATDPRATAPADARAYIITPIDGQRVETTFIVRFGLSGMGVAPAGVERDNTGHHHLLIDTDVSTLDLGMPLPATDKIRHFGGGQTETVVELPPGQHTLQLLLGNHLHVPHEPAVLSDRITVNVE